MSYLFSLLPENYCSELQIPRKHKKFIKHALHIKLIKAAKSVL